MRDFPIRAARYPRKPWGHRLGAPAILFLVLLSTACGPAVSLSSSAVSDNQPDAASAVQQVPAPLPTPASLPSIVLPISVYIVDGEDDRFASARTEEDIAAIYERVNDIWSQGGIGFDVQTIQRLALPDDVILAIRDGNFRPFLAGIDTEFSIPTPSLLNGFYASRIGGPNGIAPAGVGLFFVTDIPSVLDERVTAHEIGHILGLHHELNDPDRLMFSGTNGMRLNDQEVSVARYVAQGILDHLR